MSVTELEAVIRSLKKEDLAQFNQWYVDYFDETWEAQMRQDAKAGKLDFLVEEAQKERAAEKLRRFP